MARRLRPDPERRNAAGSAGGRRDGRRPRGGARADRGLALAAWPWPPRRGGGEVARANRGHTLRGLRTGGPVARRRPTGEGDDVQALWRRREAWGNPGPCGREGMPLDEALEFVAREGFFRIHAP
jgi:hypothetical protein